ncbi:hypothetical protein NPIL_97791 [Nephila pilipes]|uniref:Spider venom protein n=1 Tax=Nephila pilipes TaxID=299642 RepID=A0A8X6MR61_NEPPI|nr:hypothetical protein NPIL_97791 [Nephila pilipes]
MVAWMSVVVIHELVVVPWWIVKDWCPCGGGVHDGVRGGGELSSWWCPCGVIVYRDGVRGGGAWWVVSMSDVRGGDGVHGDDRGDDHGDERDDVRGDVHVYGHDRDGDDDHAYDGDHDHACGDVRVCGGDRDRACDGDGGDGGDDAHSCPLRQ